MGISGHRFPLPLLIYREKHPGRHALRGFPLSIMFAQIRSRVNGNCDILILSECFCALQQQFAAAQHSNLTIFFRI
jgi:hypothetical protein